MHLKYKPHKLSALSTHTTPLRDHHTHTDYTCYTYTNTYNLHTLTTDTTIKPRTYHIPPHIHYIPHTLSPQYISYTYLHIHRTYKLQRLTIHAICILISCHTQLHHIAYCTHATHTHHSRYTYSPDILYSIHTQYMLTYIPHTLFTLYIYYRYIYHTLHISYHTIH